MDLASVTRSGSTPRAPVAPPQPAVMPVLTSSKMRSVPWRSRDLPHRFQVAGVGQADADVLHHRLDDEAGDVAALQHPLERLGVVVGDDDRVAEHRPRDARGGRDGPRRVRGTGLGHGRLHRDHDLVVVAVVAALDLDELVPPGDAAGDPDGVHRRLGAGVGEAPHGEAVALGQQLGDVGVGLAGGDEERAVVELLLDGGPHLRVAVPGEQRAEAHVEVDVVVAVDVLEPRRLGPLGHDRVGVVGLEGRGHAEGEAAPGPLRRRLGAGRARLVAGLLDLGDLASSSRQLRCVGIRCGHGSPLSKTSVTAYSATESSPPGRQRRCGDGDRRRGAVGPPRRCLARLRRAGATEPRQIAWGAGRGKPRWRSDQRVA